LYDDDCYGGRGSFALIKNFALQAGCYYSGCPRHSCAMPLPMATPGVMAPTLQFSTISLFAGAITKAGQRPLAP
jgi:hypothetical protein